MRQIRALLRDRHSHKHPIADRCVRKYDDGVEMNPLLSYPVQFALLATLLLGSFCTVVAARAASRGEMALSGAVTVLLLNLVLVIGPLAAAIGMIFWHQQRLTIKQGAA